MFNKLLLLFIMAQPFNFSLFAQTKKARVQPIEVGQILPSINLSDIIKPKELKLESSSKKWKVIYCWHSGCASCIASFKKWDKLGEEFKNDMQIALLGYTGSYFSGIRKHSTYSEIKNIANKSFSNLKITNLIFAFDSIFFIKHNRLSPHTIIVDPNNVVRAVTSDEIDADILQGIIGGQEVSLSRALTDNDQEDENPLEKMPRDSIHTSSILLWNNHFRDNSLTADEYQLDISGVDIRDLYKVAYTGTLSFNPWTSAYRTIYKTPVIEIDPSDSIPQILKQKFRYILRMTNNLKGKLGLFEFMKRDLLNIFGYSAFIETRVMPCYTVKRVEEVKVPFGSKVEYYKSTTLDNVLKRMESHDKEKCYFFNETGLADSTILEIPEYFYMTRKSDLLRIVANAGFSIERTTRPMKVIVLRKEAQK